SPFFYAANFEEDDARDFLPSSRCDSHSCAVAAGIALHRRESFRAAPRPPLRTHAFVENHLRLSVCRYRRSMRPDPSPHGRSNARRDDSSMNLNTTIDTETTSLPDVTPGKPQRKAVHGPGGMERWLHDHVTTVALFVTAAGFVARIVAANGSYFNPDEILHYFLINEPSLFLANKASPKNAHPPLVYLLLYVFHFAGHSEFVLRLPLVLA